MIQTPVLVLDGCGVVVLPFDRSARVSVVPPGAPEKGHPRQLRRAVQGGRRSRALLRERPPPSVSERNPGGWCRRSEVPAAGAASAFRNVRSKAAPEREVPASALVFPKFVSGAPQRFTNFGNGHAIDPGPVTGVEQRNEARTGGGRTAPVSRRCRLNPSAGYRGPQADPT